MLTEGNLFWETENESALLNRNGGWLTQENAADRRREALCWVSNVLGDVKVKQIRILRSVEHEEYQRIFVLDAQRTFDTTEHRDLHVGILSTVFEVVGDYHQGLGFVVAFLELLLTPSEVVSVIKQLHENDMKGYFKAEASSLFRDCRALELLIETRDPELANHLSELGIVAATFASKWFVGLCLHVLRFSALSKFYSYFTKSGTKFLFAFAQAMLKTHRDKIIGTRNVGRILEYLRHEKTVVPDGDLHDSIVVMAARILVEEPLTEDDIELLRSRAQAEQEAAACRRAEADAMSVSDDEITFSDETNDSDE